MPDGKTFSFPGFGVRRHRGLLLASGAALCCCCVDQLMIFPNSDVDNPGGWTGATFTNLDEWPADDATTEATVTVSANQSKIATFGTAMANHPSGVNSFRIAARLKMTKISGTAVGTNLVGAQAIVDGSDSNGATLVWSAGNDGVWTTIDNTAGAVEQTSNTKIKIQAVSGLASATFDCEVSAAFIEFICP